MVAYGYFQAITFRCRKLSISDNQYITDLGLKWGEGIWQTLTNDDK